VQQVLQEEGAQGFDRELIQAGQKAGERGAMGQVLTAKEGHQGGGKRLEAIIEGLQGAFSTERIADEHGHEIDHIIAPHAPACAGRFQKGRQGAKDTVPSGSRAPNQSGTEGSEVAEVWISTEP
jgi:hypothetical protein